MFQLLLKILPAVIFWAIFIFVVLQVPYPDSIASANLSQLIFFFLPIYIALVLTFNLFLKNILMSASFCLGLIFLLILKALDSLNLVTIVLIIISVYLLVSYFRKNHGSSNKIKSLTLNSKIPKLTK